MNIFYLDENPNECAKMHCDPHVGKMLIESAQLLSNVHYFYADVKHPDLCIPTHLGHPSAVWVRQNAAHYNWLHQLFTALHDEFIYRFQKQHGCYLNRSKALKLTPERLVTFDFEEPPQAMPDHYRIAGKAVQAYRNYYKEGKSHLLKYTRRSAPSWL
jgi:hypothetical protein